MAERRTRRLAQRVLLQFGILGGAPAETDTRLRQAKACVQGNEPEDLRRYVGREALPPAAII